MASLIEIKVNISLLKLSNSYSRARKRVGLFILPGFVESHAALQLGCSMIPNSSATAETVSNRLYFI